MTAKGISSKIDNASGAAFAADFGLAWRKPESPFRFGIAVRNLGTKIKPKKSPP